MKKIMMVGKTSCGKTTLCQCLNNEELLCRKTQTIQIIGNAIDTPGEYLENRSLTRALVVSAVEADVVLFVQDCTELDFHFSPGQASMFSIPVIGVVTKIDLAGSACQIQDAVQLLKLSGAQRIFCVSGVTGEGTADLLDFLQEDPLS